MNNTPIEILSLAKYINQIDEITDSGEDYIYRGQEDAAWRITSSAYRRLLAGQTDPETGSLEIIQPDPETSSLKIQPDTETGLLPYLFVGYLKQIIDEIQLSDNQNYAPNGANLMFCCTKKDSYFIVFKFECEKDALKFVILTVFPILSFQVILQDCLFHLDHFAH